MTKSAPGKEPWMSPSDYGRSLKIGLGVNLLVRDVGRSVRFAEDVLGATATYWDDSFAALRVCGAEWMLHSDHSYRDNPVRGAVDGLTARGGGVELRIYGLDPDTAEAAARRAGATVLAGSMDKPHGLRECAIVDDDGYVWVPGVALGREPEAAS
ncbi:MAG TPA: hypothetical protein VJS40_10660 [Aestuariivirgaceae bacterium]|nr:hypothetical protein [Aestuariivirgaceae bacterium]